MEQIKKGDLIRFRSEVDRDIEFPLWLRMKRCFGTFMFLDISHNINHSIRRECNG